MYAHLSWMSWYWLFWLVGGFLAPELYFVFTGSAWGTLSDSTWAAEDLNLNQPFDFAMWTDVHWLIALAVWGLFLWLSLHIPFGLLR